MDRLREVLDWICTGHAEGAWIPRFDMDRDAHGPPQYVSAAPMLLVLEGWFVGGNAPGYEWLNSLIDRLVYIDTTIQCLKRWRFERESLALYPLSQQDLAAFWEDALAPGIRKWVLPIEADADAVVRYDEQRNAHVRFSMTARVREVVDE